MHAAAQRRLRQQLHAWAAWQQERRRRLRRAQLAVQRWQQTVCRSAFHTWWGRAASPAQQAERQSCGMSRTSSKTLAPAGQAAVAVWP